MSNTQEAAAYSARLERIAAVALQGLLAQSTYWAYPRAADEAIQYADALLARIDERAKALERK